MTYQRAVRELKQLEKYGIKPGLRRMQALMDRLGNPHLGLKVVHVAGTNGKGSVCAMLDSCLRAGGYRCGLYTSPHLKDLRERFQVQGVMIRPGEFSHAFARLKPALESMKRSPLGPPTFYEATTALGLLFFAQARPDLVVMETGLGGRFDATNLFPRPLLCLITNIELEHTQILGSTVEKIAWEKAGIAKAGASLATGASGKALDMIRREWRKAQGFAASPGPARAAFLSLKPGDLWFRMAGKIPGALIGGHQQENKALVLAGLDLLRHQGIKIDSRALARGLAEVRWPGRLQRISLHPAIWLDGAHNPAGAEALARALPGLVQGRLGLVLGVLADKDWRGILRPLLPLADRLFLSAPKDKRALPAVALKSEALKAGAACKTFASVVSALKAAKKWAGPGDTVAAAGSLYNVGEILNSFKPGGKK